MSRTRSRTGRAGAAATVAAALAGALVAAPPAAAAGPGGSPERRLDGPSPFADCTADASPGDTFTLHAESESHLAVDPRRPWRRAVAYRQDLWASGSSRGIVVASTADGGRTWRRTVLPGVGACAGGANGRATNPWVAFGPSGVLYATVSATGQDATGVVVSRSWNGGRTWSDPVTLTNDPRPRYFNDKSTVTVDPRDPRRVYAVWNRRDVDGGTHDLLLAVSDDGGRTFAEPRSIHRPQTPGAGTFGGQVVVLPDGRLVTVFLENEHPVGGGPHPGDLPERVRVLRSADRGATWSAPVTVADVEMNTPILPDHPPYVPMMAPGSVPDIAVDGRTGKVYVVWGEAGLSRSLSAVGLSASEDGGATWTPRRKANLTPDSDEYGSGQAFLPQVDVAADGTVGVSYYDFRGNTPEAGAPAAVWLATCRAGDCAAAGKWTERRLAAPADLAAAPYWFGGPYIGTYTGLAHAGRGFVAALVTGGAPGDPTRVVVTRPHRAR
ncbi:sialidase family protein [Actinomadura rifamycini]|uniref:sialidase family protein n=1 Tax=Actinomadura rifamycini TaxID=31962 RepID=UPI000421B3A6|nr:sialidase family protein [Actinomadura rifamycini]